MQNKYKKIKYCIFYICIYLLASACSTPSNDIFKENAEITATNLFNSLFAKKYEEMFKLYDPRFFEHITPIEWVDNLEKLEKKLGPFQSIKQTASDVTQGFSQNSTATTVLVYRVYYEKTYTIQKLTFASNPDASNMKVVGHYIDFPALSPEEETGKWPEDKRQ